MTAPATVFTTRRATFLQEEQVTRQRDGRLSLARLVWFVAWMAVLWGTYQLSHYVALYIAIVMGAGGFVALLVWHRAVQQHRQRLRLLAEVNADEVSRLARRYVQKDTGADFLDLAHPYSGDVDVFGPASLFRLLNRTHTYSGRQRLAAWLMSPAPPDEVRARQMAAAEIAPLIDWRQQLEAAALMHEGVEQAPENLLHWAEVPPAPLPGWMNVARFALPTLTATLLALWLGGFLSGYVVLASLALHGLVLRQTADAAQRASEQTYNVVQALGAYADLFRYVESLNAIAPWMTARQQNVLSGGAASVAIAELRRLTDNLNFRRNPYFYILFGLLSLWDVHCLVALQRWRSAHGPHLPGWLDALADVEALNSLAGFAYAHPHYVAPTFQPNGPLLDSRNVAHPLMPPDKAVANSLTVNALGQTILITGSNMSGKSTFLRTLGVNVVLAQAGAVVAADQFSLRSLRLFTSMRTQDSLEESTSSFYAELKRLQTLLHLTQAADERPVFYLLDEILKGTNSADRHRGAEALIRQLHGTNAAGLVSTHDLELGRMADETDYVLNFHFQSDLREGELVFDYRLRAGVCTSFNASQLMRAMGIALP